MIGMEVKRFVNLNRGSSWISIEVARLSNERVRRLR